jgi:hypothetical protein
LLVDHFVAEVFDNVRSLYQNCPLKKRKVKHPNKEPKMQLERIPILMAYLIVVLKLMFGFVDVVCFQSSPPPQTFDFLIFLLTSTLGFFSHEKKWR